MTDRKTINTILIDLSQMIPRANDVRQREAFTGTAIYYDTRWRELTDSCWRDESGRTLTDYLIMQNPEVKR